MLARWNAIYVSTIAKASAITVNAAAGRFVSYPQK